MNFYNKILSLIAYLSLSYSLVDLQFKLSSTKYYLIKLNDFLAYLFTKMYPDTNTIKDVVNNNFKSYKINYNL